QVDFIDYFRVDHHLSWKEVEAKYASVFPEDAAKGHKRGPQGLQGVYYRKNKQIPATDQNNLFVFDEDDNPRTFQCDVREQGKKMNNSIGLLAMHPERAITYSWVSEEHKRQYEKVGMFTLTLITKQGIKADINYRSCETSPARRRRATQEAQASHPKQPSLASLLCVPLLLFFRYEILLLFPLLAFLRQISQKLFDSYHPSNPALFSFLHNFTPGHTTKTRHKKGYTKIRLLVCNL
ncbi:hypothetical protein N0V92_011796, partial [Colletotrichum tropicale]